MKNYLLTLCFDGTAYHGWQVQPNAVTVQSRLQDAAEQILGVRESVTGCSRTDAHVHADMFCCNLRTEKEITPEKLQTAFNAVLPRDIAVLSVREVPLGFHARYDCTGKAYRYLIVNRAVRDPFFENRALHYPWTLDAEALHREAQSFLGTHDFSAFCASKCAVEDKVREIRACSVYRNGDLVEFRVTGNGFLYNMVRIMAGTLVEIGTGDREPETVKEVFRTKNREKAGMTLPPQGLFLDEVFYE